MKNTATSYWFNLTIVTMYEEVAAEGIMCTVIKRKSSPHIYFSYTYQLFYYKTHILFSLPGSVLGTIFLQYVFISHAHLYPDIFAYLFWHICSSCQIEY